MNEHRPEVADVFRQYEQEFLDRWRSVLSYRQLETLRDIGVPWVNTLGSPNGIAIESPSYQSVPVQGLETGVIGDSNLRVDNIMYNYSFGQKP